MNEYDKRPEREVVFDPIDLELMQLLRDEAEAERAMEAEDKSHELRMSLLNNAVNTALRQLAEHFGEGDDDTHDKRLDMLAMDIMRLADALDRDDDSSVKMILSYERDDIHEAAYAGEALDMFRRVRSFCLNGAYACLMIPKKS